jgi:hypothetical protein
VARVLVFMRFFSLLLTLLAVSVVNRHALAIAPGAQSDLIVFSGMCDASAAIPLENNRFMVADDEDNILRIYDALKGGQPVDQVVLSAEQLGFAALQKSNPKTGEIKPVELDLEAATRIGNSAFWLTSHARNGKGKQKLERFQFIGLRRDKRAQRWNFIGKPFDGLLASLIADPRFAPYELEAAAQKGAEQLNGLNIEGMTARTEGGVYIGFRNPVPKGRALILILLNPAKIILGEKPQWLAPIELDLNGLGVRSLSSWHGDYWIVAGGATEPKKSQLYRWPGGASAPQLEPVTMPEDFNPEGFFTPEDRSRFMLISDDGTRQIQGVDCKKLKDPAHKQFRGIWLKPPRRAKTK